MPVGTEAVLKDGKPISIKSPDRSDAAADVLEILAREKGNTAAGVSLESQRIAAERKAIGQSENTNESEQEFSLGMKQKVLENEKQRLHGQGPLKKGVEALYKRVFGVQSQEARVREEEQSVDELRKSVAEENAGIAVLQEMIVEDPAELKKVVEFARDESEHIQRIALGLAVFEMMGKEDSLPSEVDDQNPWINRIVDLYNRGSLQITPQHYRQAEQLYQRTIIEVRDKLRIRQHVGGADTEGMRQFYATRFLSPLRQVARGIRSSSSLI